MDQGPLDEAVIVMSAKARNLEAALHYAIGIIENYALDIRSASYGTYAGRIPNLVVLGFCQGAIYRDALKDIERLKDKGE